MSKGLLFAAMVEFTGGVDHADKLPDNAVFDELERVNDVLDGKPGDPGRGQPTNRRASAVIAELEKRLARANATLEAVAQSDAVRPIHQKGLGR